MADFLKKCCQCYCFSGCACNVASCIDQWHSIEACGLASLYCNACCWTLCAPLCIDCKLGESGPAFDNCAKGLKYCLFSCALCIAACVDGCYNCIKVIQISCGEGVKSYNDLLKNVEFMEKKVKEGLGLETGNEPIHSLETFRPWSAVPWIFIYFASNPSNQQQTKPVSSSISAVQALALR